jgi:hypothetical protein
MRLLGWVIIGLLVLLIGVCAFSFYFDGEVLGILY